MRSADTDTETESRMETDMIGTQLAKHGSHRRLPAGRGRGRVLAVTFAVALAAAMLDAGPAKADSFDLGDDHPGVTACFAAMAARQPESIRSACDAMPTDTPSRQQLYLGAMAQAALVEGDDAAAIDYLDQAIAAQQSTEMLTLRASIHMKRGDAQSARSDLQQILQIDPDHAHARALMAAVEDQAGVEGRAPTDGSGAGTTRTFAPDAGRYRPNADAYRPNADAYRPSR